MIKLYWLILAFSSCDVVMADTETISRNGDQCQICIKKGVVEVCRFYKKCPVKEEKFE
jgi:hypothetical protein